MKQLQLTDINTDTLEGRYLIAALAMLTTQPKLVLFGEERSGEQMTPDEMLQQVSKLQKDIYMKM